VLGWVKLGGNAASASEHLQADIRLLKRSPVDVVGYYAAFFSITSALHGSAAAGQIIPARLFLIVHWWVMR